MDPNYRLAPALFVLVLLLVFFLFLHAILFLLSRTGGWHAWAKHYARKNVQALVKLTWANGKMKGFAKYGNTLTLGVNEDGLILATIIWFRLFHPTLVLPWNEIRTRSARYFFSDVIEVYTDAANGVSIKLYPRELKQLAELLQNTSPEIHARFVKIFLSRTLPEKT